MSLPSSGPTEQEIGDELIELIISTSERTGLEPYWVAHAISDVTGVQFDIEGGKLNITEEALRAIDPQMTRARIKCEGLTLPHVSAPKPKPVATQIPVRKSYPIRENRRTAFCLGCNRERPFVYGYVSRPTMAATIDLGGPVNLTRVLSSTEQQTFCAVCNHRVITEQEGKRIDEEAQNEKDRWNVIWVFAAITVVILVVAIANAPNN